MNMSQSIAHLSAAFTSAQSEIEGAVKDKVNPAFRSKYADLGAVVDAIKPALARNGLAFVQRPHDAENAAKVETVLIHKSGEWMSLGEVTVPVTKFDAHGFGSALTYARRYGLLTAFGVAPEDDDGNAAAVHAPAKTGRTITPTSGYWESMPLDVQNEMLDIAHRVRTLLKKGDLEGAYDELESHQFDGKEDYKAALWTRLESDERSTLKKIATARRARIAA